MFECRLVASKTEQIVALTDVMKKDKVMVHMDKHMTHEWEA